MSLKPLDIPAGFHGNGTDLEESNKWIDGSLVRWLDGSLRPIGGWRQRDEAVTEKTIRGMHSWQSNDNTAWIACASYKELKAVNAGGTVYDITPDDLTEGREDGEAGTGYGNGLYGQGLYGVPIQPTTDTVPLPATTFDLDNYGQVLIACSVDDGKLYEWNLDTDIGSELITNGTFDADSDWTKGNGGAGGSNWQITGGVAQYIHYKPVFDANDDTEVQAAADTITITGHRFEDGDEVIYNVPASPAAAIGGLTDGNTYYVVSKTANTFKLSATSGGAAIDLTIAELDFDGDDSTIVDVVNDKIVAANTFTNGEYVKYTNGGGVDIDGLTDGAFYYIINASASEFQLSTTSGGSAVTLTANKSVTVDSTDAAVVVVADDKIVTANTFADGDKVTYDVGGGTAIGGLTDATEYFIVNATATEFQVSATSGGAAIDLTAVGTGTSHVFRLDIGNDHNIIVDHGAGHNLDRQNYGNLEQTVSGLDNDALEFDSTDTSIVVVADDEIVLANTFTASEPVEYDADGGTAIGGLVDGTTYYIVNATASKFQLASTPSGSPIDLTSVGVGTTHKFTSEKQDTHDITVTLADLDDADGPATAPSVNLKVTGTTSGTVLIDETLVVGVNRFRFGTDDDEVKVEIVPAAYNTSDFSVDNISLKSYPVAEVIDNSPTGCLGAVVTEERFIFALGAGNNSKRIEWCDFEDRDTWTPSTTNQAGGHELQTAGQIMCGIRTRGQTLIITDTDAHAATYVGPPYVFSFSRVGSHCGAVSRKSAVSTDMGVFWYGQENFFLYDGNRVQVVPCDVHDYVFDDFNTSQQSKVWGFVNGTHQEVWWFYPSSASTEVDRYVAYDMMEKHWLVGELSRTAGVARGVFAYPILAERTESGSDFMDHEIGNNYDGSTVFAETGPLSIGAGDQIAKVNSVIPDEKTQGDVQMTFKTRFHPNDTERSYGPFDPSNPTSVRFSGRQIRMRVEQDQNVDWRVGIMRLETIAGGRR